MRVVAARFGSHDACLRQATRQRLLVLIAEERVARAGDDQCLGSHSLCRSCQAGAADLVQDGAPARRGHGRCVFRQAGEKPQVKDFVAVRLAMHQPATVGA